MNGPISISGTNGGPLGSHESQAFRNLIQRLFEGKANIRDIRAMEEVQPRRRSLTLLVNNECNLACRHCYLQLPKPSQRRLSLDEWNLVIDSAITDGVQHFVVVGKELFLGQIGPAVLDHLSKRRREVPGLGLGVITNGTLIHQHRHRLQSHQLCYVDLSMEGNESDHDTIRGLGSYAAVRPNVEWAARHLAEKLFITLTVQKHNLKNLGNALIAFAGLGVKNVGASFYCPLPYTDRKLDLTENDYDYFFRTLGGLGSLQLPHPVALQVDAGIISPATVAAFMRSEWFSLESMEVDWSGFLYSHFNFGNGLTLHFRFVPTPISLRQTARVTVDGELVCVEDSLQPRLYSVNRVGNVRESGCDYRQLILAASQHPRLTQLDDRFESEVLPLFKASYLGRCARKTHSLVPA
ncbi:MAG: radical SAM protein [Verrucomicrobiota bacterium]|nr:radical SAM protein [Verrucomicrobiota bacterium]